MQHVSIAMQTVGHLAPHTGKTIFCLSIPLWSSLRGAYTLYHINIKNKNILQLRTSLVNEKSQIRHARLSKVTGIGLKVGKYVGLQKLNSVSNLLLGVSRNEPNECMCQWI
jgi:hypothetical protein